MTEQDTNLMITRCISEIKQLRSQIAELQPKAHAYDTIAIHARLLEPKQGQYSSEDIIYKLEQELRKMEEQPS